jgi:hypothetical protein
MADYLTLAENPPFGAANIIQPDVAQRALFGFSFQRLFEEIPSNVAARMVEVASSIYGCAALAEIPPLDTMTSILAYDLHAHDPLVLELEEAEDRQAQVRMGIFAGALLLQGIADNSAQDALRQVDERIFEVATSLQSTYAECAPGVTMVDVEEFEGRAVYHPEDQATLLSLVEQMLDVDHRAGVVATYEQALRLRAVQEPLSSVASRARQILGDISPVQVRRFAEEYGRNLRPSLKRLDPGADAGIARLVLHTVAKHYVPSGREVTPTQAYEEGVIVSLAFAALASLKRAD